MPCSRTTLFAGLAALAALGAAAAGCSSGSSQARPAGLGGRQEGVRAGSQYAAEKAAAASSLPPSAGSFLAGKTTVTPLGSTTPSDGDINPYAIWPVTRTVGSVRAGDVLVDNFNNRSNNQGTGTTVVDLHPDGRLSVFAQLPRRLAGCPGGVGLTTAMVQLRTGWVVAGSLPSRNGQVSTAGQGCLIVLSPEGKLAGTITSAELDGPWDATVAGNQLFVATTMHGLTAASSEQASVDQGSIVRLTLTQSTTRPPRVTGQTVIASGFPERPDAAAFVKGPTGLALGADGVLYVADTLGNSIRAIPAALTRTTDARAGQTLTSGGQLAGPLGLTMAPGGDLLAANSVNGKIVEVTPAGKQVGEYYADDNVGQEPPGNGDLFDVAVDRAGTGVLFVNDGTNTLEVLH
jgi:sugar lactone lactonase YvrE